MTVIAPPEIDALPPAPDPNDRATFNSRAYTWAAAQAVMTTQVSAVATNVYNNAEAAETAASSAVASASAASASASSASSDAQSAASDAGSAEAAWTDFEKRYLGTKASEPTADNAGNPLAVGALYFNAVLGRLRTWNGAEWDASFLPASGYQEKLVAGANIKTVNGMSLLGSGDIVTALGAPDSIVILSSGTSWTCPDGVTRAKMRAVGAGAGVYQSAGTFAPSGAGIEQILALTPRASYNYSIGAPANLGAPAGIKPGGDTTFTASGVTYIAQGGRPAPYEDIYTSGAQFTWLSTRLVTVPCASILGRGGNGGTSLAPGYGGGGGGGTAIENTNQQGGQGVIVLELYK